MTHKRMVLFGCWFIFLSCSGAPPVVQEANQVVQPELEPTSRDLEFEAAQALLESGPVEKYVPLQWLDKARRALDSVGVSDDYRGDFTSAMRWAGLASKGVLKRPDSDLVYEILTEHVRICNHAFQPAQAASSLDRLNRFEKPGSIRRALIDVLTLRGDLSLTRLADGTFSDRYWAFAHPEFAGRIATMTKTMDALLAPSQTNIPLYKAWQRLRIEWAWLIAARATGTVSGWSRLANDAWKKKFPKLEKEVLRSIWHVPSEAFPTVVSVFHLQLAKFYEAAGEQPKADENFQIAQRMVLASKDPSSILRVDLAEVDRILAPGASIETLGIVTGGPEPAASPFDPPPDIRPPVPESVWQTRVNELETILMRAEIGYRKDNNRRGLAATWLRRGMLASKLNQFEDAAEYFRQSESVAQLAGDPAGTAIAIAHLLATELRAGQMGRAQHASDRLFALIETSGLNALGTSIGDALLGIAGREFTRFGNPNQRLAVIRLAAQFYERFAPPALALRHYGSLIKMAAHFRYFEEVVAYAEKSVLLAAGLENGANAASVPKALRSGLKTTRCGIVHAAAAALLAGPSCGQQCLAMAEQSLLCVAKLVTTDVGDIEEAKLVGALARAANGQPDKARKLLPKNDLLNHLEVAIRSGETTRVVTLAGKIVKRSRKWLADATPRAADAPVTDALLSSRATLAADIQRLAESLVDLGTLQLSAKAKSPAKEFLEARALLDEWKELTMDSGEWQQRPWEVLTLYGQIAAGIGEPVAAWMSFSGALAAIFSTREHIRSVTGRARFTARITPQFEQAIRFLLQHAKEEFDMPGFGKMSGRGAALMLHLDLKGQTLAANLGRGSPSQGKLIEGQDGVALEALEQRLRVARGEEAYAAHLGDSSRSNAIRKERETVESWLEQSLLELTSKYPRLAIARGVPKRITVEQIQSLANSRKLVFLVYRLSNPDSTIWVVTSDSITTVSIPADELSITLLANQIRLGLESGAGIKQPAARLYDLLVAPVMPLLPTGVKVAIVPDGVLHQLPFGILENGGRYLLSTHALFMVPALSLFADLAANEYPATESLSVLLLSSASNSAENLRPAYFPEGHQSTMFSGAKATESAFYSVAANHNVIHLAGPLQSFSAEPTYSGLKLAPAIDDEDGLLQAWEIASQPLGAALGIVYGLTGSITAWSEHEATSGLNRGFFVAGVPVLLANTVSVKPAAADAWLSIFYQEIYLGKAVCEAARTASLSMKAKDAFAHPADWGGFSVFGLGDTQSVKK
jgi:CHAT domain-containing protein